jgi:hypothetical protein
MPGFAGAVVKVDRESSFRFGGLQLIPEASTGGHIKDTK